ncbi:MAG: beta-ketoacyl-ACP synthase II [Ruminococcaceae bacterium]|nr:beta-ketoacyl-ACP synthase II [Oscillospiraceae bacterium]
MRRAVVTGMGVVSPIGNTLDEFWKNIEEGNHGFSLGQWFPEQSEEVNVFADVKDFDPSEYIDKKERRRTDLMAQYAVYAAKKALEDAGSGFEDIDPYKRGVIIGSGIGGLHTSNEQIQTYHGKGNQKVSVFTIPMMIGNMAAGTVAIKTGFKGVNYCPVSACSSGAHAVGEAFRAVKYGNADVVLAGGSEACRLGFAFAGFNNMHAITKSTDVNRASIPFDKERSGFVLGDGAGILVIEEYEHAKARGAKIYAEIAGYGATCDAYHETSPDPNGEGGAKAMEFAVKEAGVPFETINYVNAHGTSTAINDRTETAAVKKAFGDHAYKMVMNSTKSLTGHLLGAAGGVESIAVCLQMQHGLVHATRGLEVDDPECDLDNCKGENRKMVITGAVSNSLGFGGHNVSLCFLPVDR